MHTTISTIAKHWPLASRRQAKRQAVRLLRAKQYLTQRGIAAHVPNSEFKYISAPQVLHAQGGL